MTTVLGIAGGPNVLGAKPWIEGLPELFFHDSAAALLRNGRIIHAVEEERVSRVKHTNAFPTGAIRACLDETGTRSQDIDGVAYFFDEGFCEIEFRRVAAELGTCLPRVRSVLRSNLSHALKFDFAEDRIYFAKHHFAHAAAAHDASGFAECLVVVLDGRGEKESVSIFKGTAGKMDLLTTYPVRVSPGFFYRGITRLLGFGKFDEYKVMGLAPYGHPGRFRDLLAPTYKLLHGENELALDHEILSEIVIAAGIPARTHGEPITQAHKDFAAAAQELLEKVCLDVIGLWQSRTGLRHLCLVGGVAQNCRMNGVIAHSGLFDRIYAHPASHDAGSAIGAALMVNDLIEPRGASELLFRKAHSFSPFLGKQIHTEGSTEQIEALKPWSTVLEWERPVHVHEVVAAAIAAGRIAGWARGRSEFGPRSLGARSILADPRPRENWTRINRVVKKREGFRPFAPAVCEESAETYFDLPRAICNLGEMCFIIGVRPCWRNTLAAITHVDGSARVQIVSRSINEDFWKLIKAFESQVGVAVLLNTSLNHSSEPIVDNPRDVIRTFLTTDLDLTVLGPYVVRKKAPVTSILQFCTVELTQGTEFVLCLRNDRKTRGVLWRGSKSVAVSTAVTEWIMAKTDLLRAADLLDRQGQANAEDLLRELLELWEARVIDILPGSITACHNRLSSV
jgi:predicted NodU family carbamoyl transferase